MNTRNVIIKTRLSEDEADRMKAAAKRCGLTPSAFLRKSITGLEPKPAPPETFWTHMNILYEICGGLRNIAHSSDEDSEYARELQSVLEKEILQFQAAITLLGKAVVTHGSDEDMGG